MYYALDKYPIDRIASEISHRQMQAWKKITELFSNRSDGLAELCITDFIRPFSHLTLESHYDIHCYIAKEIHGSFGKTAAIENGLSYKAALEGSGSFSKINLPENAVDPMEIVYCDGTPEGYLEAVLYRKMLNGFPRMENIYADGERILFRRPESLNSQWDMLLNVDAWYPRVKNHDLYCYMYQLEHGMEASNGRDRISLRSCHFFDEKEWPWVRTCWLPSKYPKSLSGKGRYRKGRQCCVCVESSVEIAEAPEAFL